ncbi:MAG: methylated-DNA--[protein]-cysteine S-methyltransferase [Promethearchaeota archaeon]
MEYLTFSSPFNTFTIVWSGTEPKLKLQRIFLSDSERRSEQRALVFFKQIKTGSSSSVEMLADKIKRFLEGEELKFDLKWCDFTSCSKLQEKVLKTDYQIPRGWVSTYKRIAIHTGLENGARAVGNLLANNPFPIIIPCHRVLKTNGELGGFQGGITMKRALLEMEGIEFSKKGKVITDRIYY